MSRSIASDLRTLDLRTRERRTKRAIARFSNPHSITEKSRPADHPDLFPAGLEMDGHEPVNFVRGEKTLLAPGMCFSNKLGICEFGAFGVRLEDCLTITESGSRLFTPLFCAIDAPFG